ncbi:MAG: LON peptidase substrate-binding domain-containing protein [Candidatus Binataceae bacterium]
MADLPSIIPIFPLPNLVLFPDVGVPLHIFEPRYRQMIADVADDHRIIGMALLKGDWEREYYGQPDVFAIGCAGRVRDIARLADGRFNILLEGFSEFRIVRELRDKPYRRAEVEWLPVDSATLETPAATIATVRELLFGYIGEPAKQAWRSIVEQQGMDGANLVNFLCFHLDLTSIEKQTLLEARGNRIACLCDILTFKLEERKLGPPGSGNGPDVVQ